MAKGSVSLQYQDVHKLTAAVQVVVVVVGHVPALDQTHAVAAAVGERTGSVESADDSSRCETRVQGAYDEGLVLLQAGH